MTENDLRLLYKRDTGHNAIPSIPVVIEPEEWADLEDEESLELNIPFDVEDVPYISWLEEKLIEKLK